MERRFVKGRVSIVTPIYNGGEYIHRLLDSVLMQTWDSVEMIVADDGSTDNTLEVCEGYRDRFETKGYSLTLVTGEHINASGAIGRGLALVSGEYLIWPDGDDEILPESISHRVRFLEEHPEYKCVRSLPEYVDYDTGEQVRPLERISGPHETGKLFWDILFSKTYVCCGCYMLRSREFFEIYPTGKIPVYNVGQNFQMLLPFMYRYECPTLEEILYRVNRRADSHSAVSLTREQEENKYAAYEAMLDELAGIIGITDAAERKRIELWKIRRRYDLAVKHNNSKGTVKALFSLYRLKDISFASFCKGILKCIWHRINLQK